MSARLRPAWAVRVRVPIADRRGVVSVEAALALALVVLPLLFGMFDLGSALTTRLRVDRALQAGLFGAWGIAGASTTQVAQAAVAGAGTGSPAVSATAAIACYCLSPTATVQGASAVACTATCPAGDVLGDWLSLTTSAPASLAFPIPGLAAALPLSATATVRIQ